MVMFRTGLNIEYRMLVGFSFVLITAIYFYLNIGITEDDHDYYKTSQYLLIVPVLFFTFMRYFIYLIYENKINGIFFVAGTAANLTLLIWFFTKLPSVIFGKLIFSIQAAFFTVLWMFFFMYLYYFTVCADISAFIAVLPAFLFVILLRRVFPYYTSGLSGYLENSFSRGNILLVEEEKKAVYTLAAVILLIVPAAELILIMRLKAVFFMLAGLSAAGSVLIYCLAQVFADMEETMKFIRKMEDFCIKITDKYGLKKDWIVQDDTGSFVKFSEDGEKFIIDNDLREAAVEVSELRMDNPSPDFNMYVTNILLNGRATDKGFAVYKKNYEYFIKNMVVVSKANEPNEFIEWLYYPDAKKNFKYHINRNTAWNGLKEIYKKSGLLTDAYTYLLKKVAESSSSFLSLQTMQPEPAMPSFAGFFDYFMINGYEPDSQKFFNNNRGNQSLIRQAYYFMPENIETFFYVLNSTGPWEKVEKNPFLVDFWARWMLPCIFNTYNNTMFPACIEGGKFESKFNINSFTTASLIVKLSSNVNSGSEITGMLAAIFEAVPEKDIIDTILCHENNEKSAFMISEILRGIPKAYKGIKSYFFGSYSSYFRYAALGESEKKAARLFKRALRAVE
jgi:hypothetical protein